MEPFVGDSKQASIWRVVVFPAWWSLNCFSNWFTCKNILVSPQLFFLPMTKYKIGPNKLTNKISKNHSYFGPLVSSCLVQLMMAVTIRMTWSIRIRANNDSLLFIIHSKLFPLSHFSYFRQNNKRVVKNGWEWKRNQSPYSPKPREACFFLGVDKQKSSLS